MSQPRGWYSRGYLPHLDLGQTPQFITWRLADSIPNDLILSWREELAKAEEPVRKRELYARVEKHLDLGQGSCVLKNPIAARIVQDTLLFHFGSLYILHDWIVMPNHVHALLTPTAGNSLERIAHANKSYTASEINKALSQKGRLWEPEYFDRAIRDDQHFERVAQYIRRNPVKAKLCTDFRYWSFGSGHPLNQEKIRDLQARMPADRGAG